jgi:3-isopropylmalate/(R)-2-methylmalate dehydratase small subunit
VQLKSKEVDELFDYVSKNKKATISADLPSQTVTAGNKKYSFKIDAFNKECLLNGLDSIGWTLKFNDKIATYEEKIQAQRPWLIRKQANV